MLDLVEQLYLRVNMPTSRPHNSMSAAQQLHGLVKITQASGRPAFARLVCCKIFP